MTKTPLDAPWAPKDYAAAARAGRLWRVVARREGSVEAMHVEADEAAPWTGGVLYFWNSGKAKGDRRTVLTLAPGEWFSLEAVR